VHDPKLKREFLEKLSVLLAEFNARLVGLKYEDDAYVLVEFENETRVRAYPRLTPETIEKELRHEYD
jgi:hypothetical protein